MPLESASRDDIALLVLVKLYVRLFLHRFSGGVRVHGWDDTSDRCTSAHEGVEYGQKRYCPH